MIYPSSTTDSSDKIAQNPSKDRSICILVYSLRGYGSERVALNLAQGFLKKGLKVDFVIIEFGGEFIKMVPQEAKTIELGVADLKSSSTWKKIRALVKYLRQERPTALVSIYDTINLATWAKILAGVSTKIFVDVQNTLSNEFTGNRGKLKSCLVRLSYPWSDGVIASSQGVAKDLTVFAGISSADISVIYNPVVTPEIFEKAEEPIHHSWFALGELPVILGVGRLSEQKDFSALIKAFAIVRKHRASRLVILGEGLLRTQLEDLVKELGLQQDVGLLGYTENPYAYMAKASVFVLSSKFEGFGNVIVEAMAFGTPIVATDCPSGPSEILDDGKYGRLVAVGNINTLAEAIVETLDKSDRSPEYNTLKSRATEFSVDLIADRYLKVLGFA